MKYEYLTFSKTLPNGKWRLEPKLSVSALPSKKLAYDNFISRHTRFQDLSHIGRYGIEEVSRLHKGGTMKDTGSFDYFFDYTIACGSAQVRYREALAKRK